MTQEVIAIRFKQVVTIRNIEKGLSDLEFSLGARVVMTAPRKTDLLVSLEDEDYSSLVDNEFFDEYVEDQANRDNGIKPNTFVRLYHPYDKWDFKFPIWGLE